MPYKDKESQKAKESQKRRNKKYYEASRYKEIEYTIPENKVCSCCKKLKDKTDFYPRKDRPSGLSSWCIGCLTDYRNKYKERNKVTRRKRDFGIEDEDYQRMLVKQNNGCAICGVKQEELNYSLCVDHDHKTGKIRGLLCHDCNVCIGKAKDNIETLKNAIKYLSI
jgi:hypothetical protein